MNTIEQIEALLHAEYSLLLEDWEEIEERGENPFDRWNAYLDTLGVVRLISYECNWNQEHGVPHLVNTLFEVVNGDMPVYVVDFSDGSSTSRTFFFDRAKATEALRRLQEVKLFV